MKSKLVAALLAIFLGGLGAHKFYLGKYLMGFVYLLFCWTFVPMIVSLFEGLIMFATPQADWDHTWNAYERKSGIPGEKPKQPAWAQAIAYLIVGAIAIFAIVKILG